MNDEVSNLLKDLDQALTDWCQTYASDHCDVRDVEASWRRLLDGGGTLSVICQLQKRIREQLK